MLAAMLQCWHNQIVTDAKRPANKSDIHRELSLVYQLHQ